MRHVIFDTNYWTNFVASRIITSLGDKGSVSLWGRSSEAHILLAEHLTAEYRAKTEGRGRRVEEWKMRPEAHDNHWFDGVVGNAVTASMCGCVLEGTDAAVKKVVRAKAKLSDLRKARMPVLFSRTRCRLQSHTQCTRSPSPFFNHLLSNLLKISYSYCTGQNENSSEKLKIFQMWQ